MLDKWSTPSVARAAGAGVIGAAFLAIAWELTAQRDPISSLASASATIACIALPCAAVLFYVQWQCTRERPMAWLVTACAAYSLQHLTWLVLLLRDEGDPAAHSAGVGLYQVVVSALLVTMLATSRRLPVRHDPLAVGVLAGLVVIIARVAVFHLPLTGPSTPVYTATVVALGLIGLGCGLALLRARLYSPALAWSVAIGSVLMSVSQASAFVLEPETWTLVVGATARVAGATLVLVTAGMGARDALQDEMTGAQALRRRLEVASIDLHSDQARFHEIRSTLAGITTATQLLHRSGLSRLRTEQLGAMIDDELARLARMVGNRFEPADGPVELDAALRPVVVRNQTQGLDVRWEPSGQIVAGRKDDVAEIVDILLCNARRHAPRSAVRIEVRKLDGMVELAVVDSGPGVEQRMRDRIFDWGARGSLSPGEGVGLAVARLLAEDLGGRLVFDPTRGPGAAFVLSLPTVRPMIRQACS